MNMQNLVEWELAGETEVLGENLPQCHLSTKNPTWLDMGSKPGRRGGKSELWHTLEYDFYLKIFVIARYSEIKFSPVGNISPYATASEVPGRARAKH
jgi:hypothetical protein